MSIYLGETPLANNAVSRNIGEIIQSTIPLNDAGLHLLDGALISGAGSYAKFVTYIAGLVSSYPDLFETEANWQSSVSTYGVCGKFVYDSTNNTVRLPKITGFTEGTIDPTVLGDLVEAGLPNITGSASSSKNAFIGTQSSGVFSGTKYSNQYSIGGDAAIQGNFGEGIQFDASRSNSIYGNSTTVQPQAIKVLYYIVIASSITNELNLDVADMATKSLDNLDSVGKNIANWSNNVTNCITEIPQDIKLELNNGTLTLKAGSVITDPQGGTQRTTTEDKTGAFTADGQYMVFSDRANGALQLGPGNSVARIGSGSTLPADASTFSVFYNSTDGKIYRWNGSDWVVWGVAFPLGIITVSNGAISSIDQVFNGFGYIGSTVFALPNVKGLIPNGRNADGSLKNIESTLTKVHTYWLNPAWGTNLSGHKFYLRVFDEVQGGFAGDVQPDTRVIYSKGIPSSTYTGVYYDTEENKWFWVNNGEISAQDIMFIGASFTANITASTFTVAGNFTPKTAFHALDYNDSSTISGWSMPSSRYIDLTLGANGATYTAPANGKIYWRKRASAVNQFIALNKMLEGNTPIEAGVAWSVAANDDIYVNIEVRKSEVFWATYNANGSSTNEFFRFVYAKGEN